MQLIILPLYNAKANIYLPLIQHIIHLILDLKVNTGYIEFTKLFWLFKLVLAFGRWLFSPRCYDPSELFLLLSPMRFPVWVLMFSSGTRSHRVKKSHLLLQSRKSWNVPQSYTLAMLQMFIFQGAPFGILVLKLWSASE